MSNFHQSNCWIPECFFEEKNLLLSVKIIYFESLFNFSFLGFPTFLTLPLQKGRVRKTVTTFLTLPFQKGRVRKTVTARKVKQRHKTAFLSRFHQKVEEIHFKLEKTVKTVTHG